MHPKYPHVFKPIKIGPVEIANRFYQSPHVNPLTNVDQGDRWRFTYRFWITHYAGPPDLSGTFFDPPNYGPPPNMPGPDELPEDVTSFGKDKKIKSKLQSVRR